MSHRPVTFHRDPAATNSAATHRPVVGGGAAPSPGTTTFRVTGGGAPRVGGVGIRVGAMSSASTASPITQAVPARSPVIGVRSGSSTGIPVKPVVVDPRPVVPSARRDSDSDSSPPSSRPVATVSAQQMPQLHLQQPSRVCVAPASDVRGSIIVSPNSSRMLADSSRLSSMSAYGASSAYGAGAGVTVAARRADSPQPSQPQSMGASMTDSARGPVTGASSVRFIPQQQAEEPRNRSASPAKSGFHTAAPMAAPSAIQLQLAATAGAHITAAPLYYEAQSAGARNATSITRFKVFARVRPFIDTEIEASVAAGAKSTADLRSVIEMVGQRTILLDPKEDYAPKNQFDFDDSLWSIPAEYKLKRVFADTDRKPFASQKAVYDMVAKGCAEDAFEGVSSAIMSYGQTGSGKTYTMMGNYNPYEVANGDGPEGIIPRVCHDVFREVERKRRAEAATKADPALRHTFTLEVTFVEVYMEKVRDLLDPSLRHARPGEGKFTEARIRQHPETGPFVEDVTKYKVESWQQCCALLERGQMQRRTMATTVHQQSSRSHAIFTITVVEEQKIPPKDKYSAPGCKRRIGRINLVDLAGSERGGFQEYVRESANINTSLLALRRVIDNLVERQNCMLERMRIELEGPAILAAGGVLPPPPPPPPQVPFRDSVLTWLLSDSFGGNARTTMIAALSPHARNFGDTLATLTWSSRARKLVTVVKANDVQQTVAKGYNTKLQEMEMRLQLQRQTVDSIRGDLAQKQAMIDDLDKKRIAVENETRRSEANAAHEYEVRNALVIQRAWREYRHGDRVRGLRDQYQALRARVAEAEAANAARRTEVNAALERTRAAESGDAGIRAELDAATADLGRYERERDAFDKLFAERMAQKRAGEAELETLKGRYAEDEATLKSAVDAAHVILTQARARNDSNRAAISRNRATVERLGPQEVQERMRHEGDELMRANDDYEETMVEPLRRRKAELLSQIEKVQAEIDKKRGGRRSQSPQASASRTDSQSMAQSRE